MPELPEVETIRCQLSRKIPFRIRSVEYSPVASGILHQRQFAPEGKSVLRVERHGKVLNFCLEGGHHLISGLGMSGGWRLSSSTVTEKHTHVQFEGERAGGERVYLAYVDPRRFGRMMYLDGNGFAQYSAKCGVDVSSKVFQAEYIYSIFKRYPRRKLKEILLEQKYFAGIGNYLACEVCAHAGLRPTRRVGPLSRRDCQKIWHGVRKVIDGQIKHKGLTFQGGYTDVFGEKGEGVSRLVVFHQMVCGLCKKTPVKKIVLAQRGTFYCPSCQR